MAVSNVKQRFGGACTVRQHERCREIDIGAWAVFEVGGACRSGDSLRHVQWFVRVQCVHAIDAAALRSRAASAASVCRALQLYSCT